MAAAVASGMPKLRIEEAAARKQARIDAGADVIVGVNKYRLPEGAEAPIDVLQIDNAKVRDSQIARLEKIKSTRDEKAAQAALARLEAVAGSQAITGEARLEHNLLHLSVEAARARCTVGEISSALEKAWGRYQPRNDVVSGAYSSGRLEVVVSSRWR